MKKLALATVTAAIALTPIAAFADYGSKSQMHKYKHDGKRTVIQEDRTDVVVKVRETNILDPMRPARTLNLVNSDEKIHINGEKIYLITDSGYKFFAPDGAYTTTEGVTYFSEAGIINHTEGPTQVVYVDADMEDKDNDGYYDGIDVDTRTRTMR